MPHKITYPFTSYHIEKISQFLYQAYATEVYDDGSCETTPVFKQDTPQILMIKIAREMATQTQNHSNRASGKKPV